MFKDYTFNAALVAFAVEQDVHHMMMPPAFFIGIDSQDNALCCMVHSGLGGATVSHRNLPTTGDIGESASRARSSGDTEVLEPQPCMTLAVHNYQENVTVESLLMVTEGARVELKL